MLRFTVTFFVTLLTIVFANDEELVEQTNRGSIFADVQLVCVMQKSCENQDSCELPCKVQGSSGTQADQVMTTTSFIDEEFEELWDEMQEKMKGLDEHQAEVLAQQQDLMNEQKRLEFENRQLKTQQRDLLERQALLERENERLQAIQGGTEEEETSRKRIQDLEIQIRVLTEQQNKLSSQQTRLVEQQNRLMQRQRKLEQMNVNLQKRQDRIESLNLGKRRPDEPDALLEAPDELEEVEATAAAPQTPAPVNPAIESKLNSIKEEMEHRISQLTGQQEELLLEQTRLIKRQVRLEEENQELRSKQNQLQMKQRQLENENRELRANLTHMTTDPEVRRQRIESSGLCEIMHGDICFGLLGDGSDELSYNDAKSNCMKYGGNLANIYDKEHYELITRYFQKSNISSGVWLGMKYNPQNFKVTLTDGTEAPFIKWNLIYPLTFASYTSMYLFVDKDPKSLYSGMVNIPPTWKYPFALCQFGM